MSLQPLLEVVQNATLLLALALFFDLAVDRWSPGRAGWLQVPLGLGVALVGIAIMATTWELAPGIRLDARSILLAVSGLFFGTLATSIAAVVMAAVRLHLGGAGAWAGVAMIVATGAVGVVWRRVRRDRLASLSWGELLLFGLIVHLIMISLVFILPPELAWSLVLDIAAPVLLVFPLGTALLGRLLSNRLARAQERAATAASESRYRALVESMEAIAWEYDTTRDRWVYVAPQVTVVLGWEPHEWTDIEFWASRIHPEDREAATAYCAECTARGEDHTFEYRFRTRSGEYRWINDVVSVEVRDGRPVKMRGFMVDVTHRKEAEHAAAQLAAERETLLAEIRHRAKNYITMIASLIHLEKAYRGERPAHEALDDIERRTVVLSGLFELLNQGELAEVRLDEYLATLASSITRAFSGTLRIRVETHVDAVPVDQKRASAIGLIVNELITNAMKYAYTDVGIASERDHTITVRLERRDATAALSVTDDGAGLPEEFDPAASSGLGVNLVRSLAGQLEGSATWSAATPGPGTRVTVTFPLP